MVYDAADGYDVYFGGENGSVSMASTWIFLHGIWTNITATAGIPPAPRTGMSMTYDASDGYVLAFGGSAPGYYCSYTSTCNDTWEFLEGHWTLLHPTVKPVCEMFSLEEYCSSLPGGSFPLTYDAADGYVVMFVGDSPPTSPLQPTETWTFHADTWTALNLSSSAIPPAVMGEQLVYDSSLEEAIMFSGAVSASGGWSHYNTTWAWSHGTWANITSSLSVSPSPRDSYGLAYDSTSSELVLFGGASAECLGPEDCSTHLLNDTWTFGASGWTNVTPQLGPSPRISMVMADDPANGTVVLFGGSDNESTIIGSELGDTWAWSGANDTWTIVYPWVPLAIPIVIASPDPVLFGGPVNLTAEETGGTPPYAYAWTFGDGGTGGNLQEITHAYTTNGPFTVVVSVRDAVGDSAQGSLNLTVLLEALVVASVTSGSPPLTVRFTGSAVGGSAPYAYAWSFGDGSTGSDAQNPVHTFNGSGVYTVELTVTDSRGSGATQTVRVTTSATGFLGLPDGEGYYLLGGVALMIFVLVLFVGRRVVPSGVSRTAQKGASGLPPERRTSSDARDDRTVETAAPSKTDVGDDIL